MLDPDYITSFKLGGPVKTVLGSVGRGTSILPVSGLWGPKVDANRAASASLGMWRDCLDRLELVKYDFSIHKLLSCYNCCPCGVVYRPKSKFCNLSYLCPFCWGRSAQLVSRGLYFAVKSLPDKYLADYNLTSFCCSRELEFPAKNLANGLRNALAGATKLQRKLVEYACQSGGYACTSIEPKQGGSWVLKNRGVFLGPPIDSALFERVFKLPTRLRAVNAPGANDIRKLVCWAFRYPAYLLKCDVKRLIAYLNARKGMRLSATYGCLRHTRLVKPDKGAQLEAAHETEESAGTDHAQPALRRPDTAAAW